MTFRGDLAPASLKQNFRGYLKIVVDPFRGDLAPASLKRLWLDRLDGRSSPFRGDLAPASLKRAEMPGDGCGVGDLPG